MTPANTNRTPLSAETVRDLTRAFVAARIGLSTTPEELTALGASLIDAGGEILATLMGRNELAVALVEHAAGIAGEDVT